MFDLPSQKRLGRTLSLLSARIHTVIPKGQQGSIGHIRIGGDGQAAGRLVKARLDCGRDMIDSIHREHAVEIDHLVPGVSGDAVAIPVHIDIAGSVVDRCIAVSDIGESGQAGRKIGCASVVKAHGAIEIFAFIRIAESLIRSVEHARLIHEPIPEGTSAHLDAGLGHGVVERRGIGGEGSA